jgi:hypothetical protein
MLNSSLDVVPKFFLPEKEFAKTFPYGEGLFLSIRSAILPVKPTLPACLADRKIQFNRKDESRSGYLLLEIPDNYLFLAHSAPSGALVFLGDGAVAGRSDVADAAAFLHAHQRTIRAFGHDKYHVSSLWMRVLALDVGGKGDFLTVVVPLRAGQADGLLEAGLTMGAQDFDRCVIAERFLHGLLSVAGLGAMAAFGTGGGNGEFLGHRRFSWCCWGCKQTTNSMISAQGPRVKAKSRVGEDGLYVWDGLKI